MKRSINLIFILYSFFILGFFLNSDPNGGAFGDYQNHLRVINDFENNLIDTLFNYDSYNTRHSPVLYIIISFFYKLNIPDQLIRIFSIHLCLFLPFIFYKCLLKKYPKVDKEILILLSGIILISPTFWSLSIWPDSRLFGLIFFCLSIYYFLNFRNEKNFIDVLKCIIAYTISSYLSPNFAVFSIFYFYFFYLEFRFTKKIFLIILINIIFSLPAFLYLLLLENNFLFNPASPGAIGEIDYLNYSNKLLIISSIIFFYLLPFFFVNSIKIKSFNLKIIFSSVLLVFFLSTKFNYNFNLTGGGIFFQFSYYFFKNNYFFFLVCIFSFYVIFFICKHQKINFLILFLLIISNPQYTIYHKYFDPLLLILFLLMFEFKINEKKLFNYRSIFIFYLYTGSFLIINIMK